MSVLGDNRLQKSRGFRCGYPLQPDEPGNIQLINGRSFSTGHKFHARLPGCCGGQYFVDPAGLHHREPFEFQNRGEKAECFVNREFCR